VWAQLRADVIGIEHAVAAEIDTCPIGAAMVAAVAAGVHRDLASAASQLPRPVAAYAPQGPRLDEAYARYRALVNG